MGDERIIIRNGQQGGRVHCVGHGRVGAVEKVVGIESNQILWKFGLRGGLKREGVRPIRSR